MNMDHTGETGDDIEIEDEVEIVAELVDDELEPDELVVDDVVVDEVDTDEDEADDPDVVDAVAQHEADEAGEPGEADDADEADEAEPEAADPVELDAAVAASAEQREVARHRHPAAAAALAKRVAMDRSARIAVGSLVLVAFLFLFVFPTRSYLAQQRQVRDARNSVQVLRDQNEKLSGEAKRLQTDGEIEKLARSQFNMVFPGEEAYNVVPPDGSPTTTTEP